MSASEAVPSSTPPPRLPWWRHPGWLAVVAYVLLVLIVNLFLGRSTDVPSPGMQQVTVIPSVVDTVSALPPVTMAYQRFGTSGRPVLLILHDDRHAAEALLPLARALSDSLDVVVPTLPGFGASKPSPVNYSLRTQSRYVRSFVEALDLAPVHVLGYGTGTALALTWYAADTTAFRSLTMLEGIGAQEYYLLGDHRLNTMLYGLQASVAWLVRYATPHAGMIEQSPLRRATVKAGQDLDLRPIRSILTSFAPPALIMHGREDQRITLAAAEEHHRLVPQSHLIPFSGDDTEARAPDAARVASIVQFVGNVEAGRATTREAASSMRTEAASQPFDASQRLPATGWTYVTLMLLLGLMTFVSEDLACIGAGLLVARGTLPYRHGLCKHLYYRCALILIGEMAGATLFAKAYASLAL